MSTPVPFQIRVSESLAPLILIGRGRAYLYLEAHSHSDKQNGQIVGIPPWPVDSFLSEIKQF
jgi:hypothetical protein